MQKMRVSILGCGNIAASMAETVSRMEDACLYAVAARDGQRAKAFAEQYGAQKWYGSYEEMLRDDQTDLVYVATPHSHHREHAKLCIEHGRAVLCEKAFARNAEEAREMIDFARERQVFIAEAMWVRYMPMSALLSSLIKSGRIGRLVGLTANLGYSLMDVERMVRPELAGGALLDLGVYTMNFATCVLGDEVKSVSSVMTPHDTGVDKSEFISLTYPDGTIASLFNTMEATTDRRGVIYGTKGRIETENINNFETFRIYNNQYELEDTIVRPEQITGYEYEVLACKRALEEHRLECSEMPHAHTLRVMEILDRIREKWE